MLVALGRGFVLRRLWGLLDGHRKDLLAVRFETTTDVVEGHFAPVNRRFAVLA